mgnify:FL=1
MAKIGFLSDKYVGKTDDDGKKQEEKKKQEQSAFRQLIEQHFSPMGDKDRLALLTTNDVRWFFHNMVSVSNMEVNKTLEALGFPTVLVGNHLCWRLFEKSGRPTNVFSQDPPE